MTSINFKANYIKPTYIKDSQKNKQEASFVELDITDRNDMKVLKKTTENWQDSLADFIYEDSKDTYLWKLGGRHIFAVTKQKDNFGNLDYNKILGLAELSEAYKLNELEILQVNPEATYSTGTLSKRKYSGVGTGILDTLKDLYPTKPMKVRSVSHAVSFYKKNGFEKFDSDPTSKVLIWNA